MEHMSVCFALLFIYFTLVIMTVLKAIDKDVDNEHLYLMSKHNVTS